MLLNWVVDLLRHKQGIPKKCIVAEQVENLPLEFKL